MPTQAAADAALLATELVAPAAEETPAESAAATDAEPAAVAASAAEPRAADTTTTPQPAADQPPAVPEATDGATLIVDSGSEDDELYTPEPGQAEDPE